MHSGPLRLVVLTVVRARINGSDSIANSYWTLDFGEP